MGAKRLDEERNSPTPLGPGPPRLAEALLRLLPAELRECVLGDLAEQYFTSILPLLGPAQARRWYWGQALRAMKPRYWLALAGMRFHLPQRLGIRGERSMQSLIQDIRYAFRTLIKSPAYSLVAVLTLALGIGANTAIFSIVNGVLLQPLPYVEDQRLVLLNQRAPLSGVDQVPFSVLEIEDYRSETQTLDEVVEYHSMAFVIWGNEEPHQVLTGVVSANFFDVLGVKAHLGRTFLPGEDALGTEPILVLSYEYWQSRLGADPTVVGRTFKVNNNIHTVVGVLPAIPQYPRQNDVYMPTSHCPTRSSQAFIDNRASRMMLVFGRLKPEATPEQSQADVSTIARRMCEKHPTVYTANSGFRADTTLLKEELTRGARPTFLLLLGISGLVLLIACANVANLALSRLLRRERELAVRAALGASRSRLLCQLASESTMLALVGGALGLLLAYFGLDLLVGFAARFTPRAPEIGIDGTVLIFTLLLAVAGGIVFGTLPAVGSRRDLQKSLADGGQRGGTARQGVRSTLVVAQVAVSLVLLIASGLMVRSFVELRSVDPGFDSDRVLALRVGLNFAKFSQSEMGTQGARRAFFRDVIERVRTLPGVQSAGLASLIPLNQQQGGSNTLFVEGQELADDAPRPRVNINVADAGYFETVGIPLLSGRLFRPGDDENAPRVALVTESLARRHWPDQDPLGRRVSFNGQNWINVVGVTGDIREFGLDQEPAEELFLAFAQSPFSSQLVVRTAVDPLSLSQTVISTVRAVDPDQTVDSVTTLDRIRSESLAPARLTTLLTGLFSALALLITVAGIGGVMTLNVSQRTHEIGVRRAVGAQPNDIIRLVLGYGFRLTATGAVLGVVLAFAFSRFVEKLLFQVSATDPLTYIAIPLLLIAIALLACYLPARRAIRVDPLTALYSE